MQTVILEKSGIHFQENIFASEFFSIFVPSGFWCKHFDHRFCFRLNFYGWIFIQINSKGSSLASSFEDCRLWKPRPIEQNAIYGISGFSAFPLYERNAKNRDIQLSHYKWKFVDWHQGRRNDASAFAENYFQSSEIPNSLVKLRKFCRLTYWSKKCSQ